jgi:hypothetical protein
MKSFIFLITVLFLGFACFYIYKRNKSVLRNWYWPSLLLHILCGLAIGALYMYHYKMGDTLIFFTEGVKLTALAKGDFTSYINFLWTSNGSIAFIDSLYYKDDRALFMVKLTSIANLLSFNNYWISSLYFSLLCFFSSWKLSNTLVRYYPLTKGAIVFSFLLLPSSVFWSSGIVKESVALATLLYVVHVFLLFYLDSRITWYRIIILLISTWLLYTLKYYYVAVLMPVLITALLHQQLGKRIASRSFGLHFILWILIFLAISLSATQLHPNFHLSQFLGVLYNNYQDFISFSHPEDVMLFSSLQESWSSVMLLSPWAFFSGVFRPFIWESTNIFQVVASLENLLLLLLTISAIPSLRHLAKHSHRMLILACLIYCFVLSVFLTLSTPNFGTLIRYRVGFLPFFTFLITASNPIFNTCINFLSTRVKHLVAGKA